jgi:branched-chain amino acid transport system permease protein
VLGHAAFFGIGAYASAILARQGIQSVFADGLSVLITTALAVIIGMPLLRLRGYYLAVATLAFGLIASSLFTGWRSLTLGPSGLGDIPPLSFGGWALKGDAAYYVLVWFVASLCILACNNLWRSRIGQAMLAVKRDEAAAAAMGINVASIKLQAFGLSALLASLSGALYAHYLGFIAPERFGTTTSFELLLAALLGGVGTPYGAVFGALLLIALPEMFVALQDYKVILYGIVFILVSLYLPNGIAGLIRTALAHFETIPTKRVVAPPGSVLAKPLSRAWRE